MPINQSREALPRAGGPNAPRQTTELAEQVAAQWWKDYQASDKFGRDRAMPELPLRASSISKRCDRALWYELAEVPKSNPPDAAGVFRMMLGQMIHDAADKALENMPNFGQLDSEGRKHGWFVEETVDLRPAGFPGSAHGDIMWYEHGQVTIVAEVKSQGGFSFKTMTTTFKGPPEGPRWEHVMQAAMVAVAVGAPRILIVYFAMESLSPEMAASMKATEFGRFTAEWSYDTADWEQAVRIEAARQRRILSMATADFPLRPERSLSVDGIPGGAVVSDPTKARAPWAVYSPEDGRLQQAGTTWLCGYCDWRDQCTKDGPDSEIVTITPKEA